MNKKADIPSTIFIMVFIVAVGVIFLFTHNLFQNVVGTFADEIEASDNFDNDSEAVKSARSIVSQSDRAWDYGFLFIALGSVVALGLVGFSTRISPIFYWVYAVAGILVFSSSILLSNVWQEMAADEAFAVTIQSFPITNAILGTFFPTLMLGALVIVMILLFGKAPRDEA